MIISAYLIYFAIFIESSLKPINLKPFDLAAMLAKDLVLKVSYNHNRVR